MEGIRKANDQRSETTISGVHPRMYLAPQQGLRVWVYLISTGMSVIRTTPGELHEALRSGGLKISRRALTKALNGLNYMGFIDIERRGHMMTIKTGVVDG